MSYIDALSQKAAVYSRTMAGILSKAETEQRSLTAAEQGDFSNLEAKARAALESVETAKRSANLLSVPGSPEVRVTNNNQADAPWDMRGEDLAHSFGSFLRAVRSAGSGGGVDPRLTTRAAGANEGFDSDGGYLVTKDFSSLILRKSFADSPILSRVRRIPISGNSNGIKIPFIDETSRAAGSRFGGVQGHWVEEGGLLTDTKVKYGKHELELKKLACIGFATSEFVADTAALGSVMLDAFRREVVFRTEDAIIRGSGAGMPLGVLSSPALVTVAKEQSQTADTVVSANIFKMFSRMHAASIPNSVWLANVQIAPQLFAMTIGTSSASPVFLSGGNVSERPFSLLLGRPLLWVEHCSALGDVGDLIFADLGEYLLAEKSMQASESMHVRFLYDEQAYRLTWRLDGQPAWHSALTPFKGSDTVSPFVTLEAR